MGYTFADNLIASHRLGFFPAPNLHPYEENPATYEDDELFGDIVGEHLVKFPIRFDFSSSDEEHVEFDHPRSHLTLGQYKNCRIPVTGPITPTKFISFLVRSFYFPALSRVGFNRAVRTKLPDTITAGERNLLHVVT